MKYIPILLILASFFACYAPRTTVHSENQNGRLTFSVTPETAEIYIDGKFLSTVSDFNINNSALNLTDGMHVISLRAKGYESYEKQVYLSNTQENIKVNLKKSN